MERNKLLQELLDSITPEEHLKFQRQRLESEAYHRYLEETGQECGTETSISIKILKENGFNPIGITYYMGEETFIFQTQEEIDKVWGLHLLGWDGWFYTSEEAKALGIEYKTV